MKFNSLVVMPIFVSAYFDVTGFMYVASKTGMLQTSLWWLWRGGDGPMDGDPHKHKQGTPFSSYWQKKYQWLKLLIFVLTNFC